MSRHSKVTRTTVNEKSSNDWKRLKRITIAGILIAFPAAFWDVAQFPSRSIIPAFYAGISLLFLGSALRRHCFSMLGADFTTDVRAREDQAIVDTGAYAFIRHPSYTAGMIIGIGIGLSLGSFLSLFFITAATLFAYIQRIRFEEQTLVGTLGEKYQNYASGRKRLIPFIY